MLLGELKNAAMRRTAALLSDDSADLFRNKARDCPGGRRRYLRNAEIYERQFHLRGKNSATFYVKAYFTCIAGAFVDE